MRIRPRGHIRSHRMIRRKVVAPWIVATLVTIVVVTMVSTGFYFLTRKPCSGQVTATIVASASTSSLLENAARSWSDDQPVVGGRCASVEIESVETDSFINTLGEQDSKSTGNPPVVWIPDSTAWMRRATTNAVVAKMFPEKPQSVGRSVSVIAMPKPMAEALGWPNVQITWGSLVNEVAAAGWAKYGKPEWGPVRLGISDPTKSTGGLLALINLAGSDAKGQPSAAGLATIAKLKQIKTVQEPSTAAIIGDLGKAGRDGMAAVAGYVSAFPALEIDVVNYNLANPPVPLVAIYPTDGSTDADNPYLVLDAPWVDDAKRQVAEDFGTFLRSTDGRRSYQDLGYRDAKRAPSRDLTEDNGVRPKVTTPQLQVPPDVTVTQILTTWTS